MSDLSQQKQERIAIASAQQRNASDPKFSVWVEASAGTGKTKVLSDRVLRLLLSGANPSKILCLTYTKAAAVEMSNRIASRLSSWAVMPEENLKEELSKLLGITAASIESQLTDTARRLFAILLDVPGGLKIQTFHSFCEAILKRFPLEAKISPYFSIIDDRSAKEAIENIKLDILRGNTSKRVKEAIAYIAANTSEFRFPRIMDSITSNHNHFAFYLQQHGGIDNLINHIASVLQISTQDTAETQIAKFWHEAPQEDIKYIIEAYRASDNDNLAKLAVATAQAVENKNFADYADIFVSNGEMKKRLTVKKTRTDFPQIEDILVRESNRIIACQNILKSISLLQSTTAILILSVEILSRYQHYKDIHSQMDFNDLLMLTNRLLATPKVSDWVLYKLDGGIDNILIDEAQDTSPAQWSVIKSLTSEFFSGLGAKTVQPTIFVVGDRKQSIYSFQGADPQEFAKMHDYFKSRAGEFRDVNMEVSFRSTAAILDIVNQVFLDERARKGVAADGQNIAHIPSRIGDGGRVELWSLCEPEPEDKSDKVWYPPVERVSAISPSTKLAQQIAETIKQKVSRKELLQSQGRPLRYRDFLILVQQRTPFVEELVRACKNAGVAITGVDKIKLSEQIVVSDLLACAKFTLLPSDDLNLCCVLKSPLFALDDDDLFELCYSRGDVSVWERLCQNDKYQTAQTTLQELIELSKNTRPFEFFNHILSKLNGRIKFVARLGTECEDAIDELINLTIKFEQEHIPTLQTFVDWMEADDVEIKRDLEQPNLDAVRLMTVHGSKGLQAPIVILPDTVRVKSLKKEAAFLKGNDILLYPLSKNEYDEHAIKLMEKEQALNLEEYHRLLYVALTRAEECLCVCGFRKKNAPKNQSWYEICKTAFSELAIPVDDKLIYEVTQENQASTAKDKSVLPQTPLPSFIDKPAPEEAPLARPLTPSHQDESKISALSPLLASNDALLYNRGRLIHKLLQFIPSAQEDSRDKLIADFLNNQAQDLSDEAKQQIANEVLSLISSPQFAPLFSSQSSAEVSIMGEVDGRIINGQIDRLVVMPDKVMIIDYKTNRPAAQSLAEVPLAYIKQMQAYKQLISRIYPNKTVETYILWTNTAQIMKIE